MVGRGAWPLRSRRDRTTSQVRLRNLLDGNAVENAVTDLWALYDFVSPGRPFGTYEDFRQTYDKQEDAPRMLAQRLQVGSVQSSLLRREKKDVLLDLPAKEYKPVPIAMTTFQRDQERALTRNAAIEAGGAFKILEQLQKLYQHPWLLDSESEHRERSCSDALAASPKLASCMYLLVEICAAGEKVLIFTLWTRMQWLLQDVIKQRLGLQDVPIINGDPQNRKRAQERIESFSAAPGFAVIS
jgi:SNF2 family DNA or RNA helicase